MASAECEATMECPIPEEKVVPGDQLFIYIPAARRATNFWFSGAKQGQKDVYHIEKICVSHVYYQKRIVYHLCITKKVSVYRHEVLIRMKWMSGCRLPGVHQDVQGLLRTLGMPWQLPSNELPKGGGDTTGQQQSRPTRASTFRGVKGDRCWENGLKQRGSPPLAHCAGPG